MNNIEPIINAANISKPYGSMIAVDHLNLKVFRGEFFGFLGPNGAGKTTSIRILTGIITPDSGTVSMGDTNTHIGVLSESRGFYEWMTGEEYLRFFADLYGVVNRNDKVKKLLSEVGLTARKDSPIATYSRGMKQRLGLARTLVNDPKIIFLDEPTLGLDPQGQEDIHQLLKKLNAQGVTIFYSSHVLQEVSQLCSRIAIINKGRLVAEGTLDELRQQTNKADLREIFLNVT